MYTGHLTAALCAKINKFLINHEFTVIFYHFKHV